MRRAASTQSRRSLAAVPTLPPALYRSDDGLAWEPAGSVPLAAGGWAWDVAAGSGQIYAVSTQPAAAPVAATFDPGQLTLTSSNDDGITWNDMVVPIDLGAVRTLPGVKSVRTSSSIAVGATSTLVAAVTNAEIDVLSLTPDGVDPADIDWWSDPAGPIRYEHVPFDCATPPTSPLQGVEPTTMPARAATTVLVNPAGQCSTRGAELQRYAWADLGVGPDTVRARHGSLHLARSDDGGATFTPVGAPTLPDGWNASGVEAVPVGEGFAVFVRLEHATTGNSQEFKTVAYLSADGSQWEATEVPALAVSSAGVLADGTLAVVGYDAMGLVSTGVYREGGWYAASAPTVDAAGRPIMLDGPSFQAIGPLGIAFVGIVADPTGESSTAGLALTPGVEEPVPASSMPAYDPSTMRPVLLFSRDGVAWSVIDLANDIDTPVARDTVRGVSVTADRIAIATSEWTTGDVTSDTPLPDQRVLLGTLA